MWKFDEFHHVRSLWLGDLASAIRSKIIGIRFRHAVSRGVTSRGWMIGGGLRRIDYRPGTYRRIEVF